MCNISEHQIQHDFIMWARKQDFVLLSFSVPNGFNSNTKSAIIMKKEGLLAGIPDTITVLKNGKIAWIEFKTATGKLSKEQEKIIKLLKDNGQNVAVCRSAYEANCFLKSLLDK